MQCAPRFALITLFLMALAACERSQVSVLGPTVTLGGSTVQLAGESDMPLFGALGLGVHNSAGIDSGFLCFLFGFPADKSHATVSESGNHTLHCSGPTPFPETELEGFLCEMHFPDDRGAPVLTTDSRFAVKPSGEASLTCKAKKD